MLLCKNNGSLIKKHYYSINLLVLPLLKRGNAYEIYIPRSPNFVCRCATGVPVTEIIYFTFPLKLICQQICQCLHNADLS